MGVRDKDGRTAYRVATVQNIAVRKRAEEERSESEVLGAWGVGPRQKEKGKRLKAGERAYVRVANPTSGARNPGFDVTPPELITGIITPAGIFKTGELWKHRAKLGGPK